MPINKIIIFINVMSCFGFVHMVTLGLSDGHVPTGTGNNFTVDQYLGVWYQVAVMYPTHQNPEVICEWFNITAQNNCEGCFNEVYRLTVDGKSTTRIYGHGTVVNSKVYVTFPKVGSNTRVVTVMSYNNGEELILRDQGNAFELVSRRPTASQKVTSEFERLAKDVGLHVIYVNHDICRL